MPRIIDYELVLERLQEDGLRCHYYNGGAFGFPAQAGAKARGWIGPEDGTIKPEALAMTRRVAAPYEKTLAELAAKAWQEYLGGDVWVMPVSHWSYELNFGSKDWLAALLGEFQLDAGMLIHRANAAAIEFSLQEVGTFGIFIQRLLEKLAAGDFLMAFPRRGTVCTVHHHRQLWWVSRDAGVISKLDELVPG